MYKLTSIYKKLLLTEKLIGNIGESDTEIYINPQTIKPFDNGCRLISTPNYTLYLSDNPETLHDKMGIWLNKNYSESIPSFSNFKNMIKALKNGYVTWVIENGMCVPSTLYANGKMLDYFSELDLAAFKLNKKFNFKFEIE